jgi:hypothetical protein
MQCSARNVTMIVILCLGLGLLGAGLMLFPPTAALRATVIERISGETPEAKIEAFGRAIARGDEQTARNVWELPAWELPDGRSVELQARRERVTRELMAKGIQATSAILDIEWWRTCCEPGVINDSHNAGGARVRVQLLDRDGAPLSYTFDVFTREQPYWGEAMGCPPRQWVVRDVYPSGEEPLFWRWIYEPSIRWLASPTPTPSK